MCARMSVQCPQRACGHECVVPAYINASKWAAYLRTVCTTGCVSERASGLCMHAGTEAQYMRKPACMRDFPPIHHKTNTLARTYTPKQSYAVCASISRRISSPSNRLACTSACITACVRACVDGWRMLRWRMRMQCG